jgi:Amt family ammonium transporter
VGGILGSLVVAVFASTELGVFSGYGFADGLSSIAEQFSVQAIGVVSTIVFTAVATFVILKLVGLLTGGLRVDEEAEERGLDVVSHEESGYNL